MIKKHTEKMKKANSNSSIEETYKNYKEQRKNTIDSTIVDKKIEEDIYKTIEKNIGKILADL